jgi:ArsR family transcriptional regulator
MFIQTPTYEVSRLEANLCYAFVDSTRILIIYALNERPHSVTELSRKLVATQSKISRHLKVLRNLGLVDTSRQGVTITYQLTDHRLIEALDILRGVLRDNIAMKAGIINDVAHPVTSPLP